MSDQFVIFTDMDGTLLDHHSYSHEAAKKMLAFLKKNNIPVIPNTSKTYDEMQELTEQLDLQGPFIVENGAAIHIPHGFFKKKPAHTQWVGKNWVRNFTSKKSYWLSLLKKIESDFAGQFTHFSKMTLSEICDATGLEPEQAKRAANRLYGEPVLWLGSEQQKKEFIKCVTQLGAKTLIGGRFIHISGETDKGAALNWFVGELQRQYPEINWVSIALGDGQNDAAMLDAADIAVRIKSPVNDYPQLQRTENVFDSQLEGPEGWTECLQKILNLTLKEPENG
ncbi:MULTISPECIES: HAD-IIB family hydrolase [Alteromonadaceae]|uniref:HAD-IIB family hydrolase n=1 Tax=Alteromonadaceae TaxID=72275 RepID=UPI001C083D41|nr:MULTISPECIES: HAD-IIB family hydrolase [Aliiglaciecola]MBU2877174.1 HAD-IIB family hydrolase [Aliiglaciecola lipolytica]MDO6712104.1 HAD-IIB family hydrolase [Aliiglaciecola sp. 2_MG-2023]MDO6753184.1 HAD-IIB family hydrolase [Aliiglaciecola sp. 1_MG-2023]